MIKKKQTISRQEDPLLLAAQNRADSYSNAVLYNEAV